MLRRAGAGVSSRLPSITLCRLCFSKYGASAIRIFSRVPVHWTMVRSLIVSTRTLSRHATISTVYPYAKLHWPSPVFFIVLVKMSAIIPQGKCVVIRIISSRWSTSASKGYSDGIFASCASSIRLGERAPHKTAPLYTHSTTLDNTPSMR